MGAYLSLSGNGREVWWGWVLVNCFCLITGWALIRGWATLIRINTVTMLKQITFCYFTKK